MAPRLAPWNTPTVRPRSRLLNISLAAVGLGLSVVVGLLAIASPAVHAEEVGIVVTSTLDDTGEEAALCPSETLCTLREAISTANADASGEPVRITFDPEVFPLAMPSTIEVVGEPLPELTRDNATIDGGSAGVSLTGPTLEGPAANGLTVAGMSSGVTGLRIHGFAAACLYIEGQASFAGTGDGSQRNYIDECVIGILVTGVEATVAGNIIGMAPGDGETTAMQSGVVVSASGVTVGGPGSPIPLFNAIGNVETAVRVGRNGGGPFQGVEVRNNLIGESYERASAPVTTAVLIDHPSDGTSVRDNRIVNAVTGILVVPDSDTDSSLENTIVGNSFESIGGLAIDLAGDGIRNPNDAGDEDVGPNNLLNSPEITTSTQAMLTGTTCASCRVVLYVANHSPGGIGDFPLDPIIGGDVIANDVGMFTITSPLVSPGDWLMAITIDPEGNTSEFSDSVYVGAGTVQCGNVPLETGWNLVGYFAGTASLDSGVLPSGVLSAHRLLDGENYASWFPDGPSTLAFIQTGEPYWLYSEDPGELSGGISLSTALPVSLAEGWNDFVYIGAAVGVPDALASVGDNWEALYRYDAISQGWRLNGGANVPGYANGFTSMEPCTAYRILMTEGATLVPLEP